MININFHRKKEKKISQIYMATRIITVLLFFVALFFIKYIISNEFISAQKYMEQSVIQTASNLRGRISNSKNEIIILSEKLDRYTNSYTEDEIIEFFKKHIDDYNYKQLIYVFPNGIQISYNKEPEKVSYASYIDEETINKALEGQLVFVGIKRNNESPSKYIHEYAVPVYDSSSNKKIVGVLATRVYSDTFINILGFNNYDKKGFSYVIDMYGDYVIKSSRDESADKSFFEKKIKFIGTNKEKVEELLKKQDKGSFIFKDGKQKYLASFAIVDSKDRLVFTIVPIQVLMLHIDRLLGFITFIVFVISIILLLLSNYSNKLLKQEQETVFKIAFFDEITGAGNINKFNLEGTEIIESNKDKKYSIIALSLSNFQSLKELYGKDIPNQILKDVYDIIKRNLSENSLCVRDFEYNYLVLYKYDKEEFIIKYFIDKIRDEIELYNEKNMKDLSLNSDAAISFKLSVKFGIYLLNDYSIPFEQMCERAYMAKRNVRDDVNIVYRFYDEALRVKLLKEKRIEDEMNYALKNNQFHMYLQPKFNLSDGTIAGAEALVRWIHPREGIIPPIEFIPLFEQNGFVMDVDRCIWKQACEFLLERKKAGKELFPISVNVSRMHLNNDSFVSDLFLLVKKYGISPKYLELELTESASFNDEEKFLEVTNKLKEFGFTIAMDDFGTGYSSLTMLRELPVDVLKLDRGFIKDTIDDEKGQIVIRSIIDMANKLNMQTVAEGIEREEQAEFLKNVGCKIAQGFLYGKPVDSETFVQKFFPQESDVAK